jgi:OmpA-OmpF porin, OOP family
MTRTTRLAQLCVLAAALVVASRARAQRGIDVHLHHPTVDGYGLFTVERADTAPAWSLGLKLVLDFANQPLSVRMTDPSTATREVRRQILIDWQLVADVTVTLGITNWLEAVLEIPVSDQSFTSAYGQYGAASDPAISRSGFFLVDHRTNIPPPNAGPLDIRFGLKARAYRNSWFGLGALALATFPFGDDSAFLGDSNYTFRPTVVVDFQFGHFTLALNAGAILRQTTRVVDPYQQLAGMPNPNVLLEVGHELTWAAGVGYRVVRWLGLAAEVYGYEPLVVSAGAKKDRTIDVIGGLQLFATPTVSVSLGAGLDVVPDAARHDQFRVFAGVGWAPEIARERRALPGGEGRAGDLDDDMDGIPNRLDHCPREPEDRDGFQDDDGCPDLDNDGDGIPDAVDHCPNEPEDFDGFEDADGCPDLDNDGDGIPDAIDKCPNEPETRNGIDDEDGCPDSAGAPPPVRTPFNLSDTILFEVGRAILGKRAEQQLDGIAEKLRDRPYVRRVRIEGHADPREANKVALSQARAEAIRNYLIRKGVEPDRLQAVGYGDSRPIDSRKSVEAHARNRRVEFIVLEQL